MEQGVSFSIKSCSADEKDSSTPVWPDLSTGCSVCVEFQVAMERSTGCSQTPSGPASSDQHVQEDRADDERHRVVGIGWRKHHPHPALPAAAIRHVQKNVVVHPSLQWPEDPTRRRRRHELAVTQKLLEELGCQVISASSGAHCLALLGSAGLIPAPPPRP
ncbi:hypothetical protein ZWY2020_022782 [Hordeum vulgare]|nr:hypothetical protein ZWY2020_022782 [Hordeum vulgare]